jgi:hypothetical protein
MHRKLALGAGAAAVAATATAIALAAGSAAPALAGTTDVSGTATITIAPRTLASLAKAGLVVLPGGTGTATDVRGNEKLTFQVTGGDASYLSASGSLDLAGTLVVLDGATRRSVTVIRLQFSYDTGEISGVAGGKPIALSSLGGVETGSENAGPPVTETFSASADYLTRAAVRYLDKALRSTAFKKGSWDLGGFSATYQTQAVPPS